MEKKNWIKEIVEKAYRYHNGRKIVSWGYYGPSFDIDRTLSELYGLKVDFYVDGDSSLADDVHVFSPEILSGASHQYYVVIPLAFYQSVKDSLICWGYHDTDCYYFSDCVIEDSKEQYLDKHGNEIINPPRNVKFAFWGYNNRIEFPEIPGYYVKMSITAGSDNQIKIESKEIRDTALFIWEDNSLVIQKGSILHNNRITLMTGNIFTMESEGRMLNSEIRLENGSQMHMAGNSVYEGNVKLIQDSIIDIGEGSEIAGHFTGYSGSRFSIGRNTKIGGFHEEHPAFRQQNIFFASPGGELIIGDDCLFSINIKLLCGDGHTIFNTEIGENLNSALGMSHRIVLHQHIWIGANVILLDGTEIGTGSIVGAGSIVKNVFPENCVIAGNPAKVVHENRTWHSWWGLEKLPEGGE